MHTHKCGSPIGRGFLWGFGFLFGGCLGLFLLCSGVIFLSCLSVERGAAHARQHQIQTQRHARQEAARAVALQFLTEVQAGSHERAYQLTSPAFHERQSLVQFREYVTKYDNLAGLRTDDPEIQQLDGSWSGRIVLSRDNGARVVGSLNLVHNDGSWQVDRLTLR